MTGLIPLVGGPLDGESVMPGAPFVWIDGRKRRHEGPAKGRLLYRRGGDCYVFAGHTHRLCECGGYNEVPAGEKGRCGLCGADLEALRAA